MSPHVVVTLWSSRSKPHGRHTERTWGEFIERFVASPEPAYAKDRVAGFALARFEKDYRSRGTVEQVYALGLDLDAGDTTMRQATHLFPGTRAVVYTTYSSTPAHPKLRLILPLSRPVTGDEYALVWRWAETRCAKKKRKLDSSASDASRFWYIPSHPLGCTTYRWRELPGRRLDVERVLRAGARLRPLSGRALPSKNAAGVDQKGGGARAPATETFFGKAFELAGMGLTPKRRKKSDALILNVECPWKDQHTSGDDDDNSTVILPATTDSKWGLFKCSHAHCATRTSNDLLDVLPVAALDGARFDHARGLVRVRLMHGWTQRLDAKPGHPALDRMRFWAEPTRGGQRFELQVVVGSELHHYLHDLSLAKLLGRRVDVALELDRGKWKPSSARLVTEEQITPRGVGSRRRLGGAR